MGRTKPRQPPFPSFERQTGHVHFTKEGYDKLADIFYDDLMAAYGYDEVLNVLAEQEAAKTAKPTKL